MQKLTIVIVDDSPFMSRFLAIYLENNYFVITYSDSKQALEAIKDGLYLDALITDYNMPNLSGLDLIQSIRQMSLDIPIAIVCNHEESAALKLHCLESGADEFITKPYQRKELNILIENLTRKGLNRRLETTELTSKAPVLNIFREFAKMVAF